MRRVEAARAEVERLRAREDALLAAYEYARKQHLAAVDRLALAHAELEASIGVLPAANEDTEIPSPVRVLGLLLARVRS